MRLIHYGFELHPATEKMDNKVNKYVRAHKGTSRDGVEIAVPVLVKCNTVLANTSRIGDLLITPILQETHAICEFLQNREETHSILKVLLPERKEEKGGHKTRRNSSNTAFPLHFMLVFQVWTELLGQPLSPGDNSQTAFGFKTGLLKTPQIFQLNIHCEITLPHYFNPQKGYIECPYTNPSPSPSTLPQGIGHLSSVFPQVTRTVPQVSPHATGTTQLYSHAQERTKL